MNFVHIEHFQVNALAFTSNYKELISGHGYPGNDLKIWKYPSMNCLKVLVLKLLKLQ